MAERKQVDWEGVERDYSAGLLSLRELADKHGTKESSIRYKANQKDWTRDLSKKIEQKTNEKLRKTELRTVLRSKNRLFSTQGNGTQRSTQRKHENGQGGMITLGNHWMRPRPSHFFISPKYTFGICSKLAVNLP